MALFINREVNFNMEEDGDNVELKKIIKDGLFVKVVIRKEKYQDDS